jgi:hypothetical protein
MSVNTWGLTWQRLDCDFLNKSSASDTMFVRKKNPALYLAGFFFVRGLKRETKQ